MLLPLIILQGSVWPGEPVAKALDDLQSAWRWGRAPNLLTAMELVMWTLMLQRPDKVRAMLSCTHCDLLFISSSALYNTNLLGGFLQDTIPQQWLMWKQRTQNIGL